MKIKTLEQLYQAALDKRSVTCGMIHRTPTPAAWVICYQGHLLRQLFRTGIYLYQSKKPSRLRSPKPPAKSKFWTWNRPTPATPPDNTN